jgi:polyhydroxyalkanoate depolymerase
MIKCSKPPSYVEHRSEHSVPLFWPLSTVLEADRAVLSSTGRLLQFLGEAQAISHPPASKWFTKNVIRLDLPTMRLREFGTLGKGLPILVDAPYAGHGSKIVDFGRDQSLVGALLDAGASAVWATDWKSATPEMRYFSIDTYLAELNVAIDELGGSVHLVGLCQGGWLSAMLAARFPSKVASLVLAGAPIDTDASDGPIKHLARTMPMAAYEQMVTMGYGVMPGNFMLAGWKNMHPDAQYLGKYVTLYDHLEDRNFIRRTKKFESWYENPLDLPGTYYLQVIRMLFKENLFARGRFVGLGRKLQLGDITCPVYLLAGEDDDVTTSEQVFAAAGLVGTPDARIKQKLVPGGHIGLFMGHRTISDTWPTIAKWILAQD